MSDADFLMVASDKKKHDDDIKDHCPDCGKTVYYPPFNIKYSVDMACAECAFKRMNYSKKGIEIT